MNRRIVGVLLCLAILVSTVGVVFSSAPALAATESIHVVKYGPDGVTVVDEATISVSTMESTLPVQGDGSAHYWMQGPTFDPANLWDPAETLNLKDKGALKGTDIKDLCELVGGAVAGDEINIVASDGYNERFQYDDVYSPEAAQGKFVACWWKDGAYVPTFADGIQLVFFAQTTNGAGQYVFGHQDMHDTLPEANWHYWYDGTTQYPSSNGLSIKYISEIAIYQQAPPQWNLELVGAISDDVSQTEFENGVACHGAATWTDPSTSDNWTGLPLWLLVGWVDDDNIHGPDAFNDALAASGDYSVKVIASDGYSKTFASTLVANNNNIIVANEMNGASLPESYYPLRLVGSALTSGGQRVSMIVRIELVFVLRPDLVVTDKHEDWVLPGSTYTVTYTVKNQGTAAAGASTAEATADGGQAKADSIPALNPDEIFTVTTSEFTFSSPNDVVVVTADSTNAVVESLAGEANNTLQNVFTYLTGVTIEVTGESYEAHASVVDQLVNPAVSYDPLTFAVEVTNTGLLDEKYELTATDQLGWTLKLDPNELFILAADPDHAEYAALSVSVPQDTPGGVSNQITVAATGVMATENGMMIGPTASYTIAVTTMEVNSVQVEVLPGSAQPQTGAPGSPISWLVVVKNTGNVENSFALAVAESVTGVSSESEPRTAWGAIISSQPGLLPAYTKWTSYLKVTVPADAATSEWNELAVTISGTDCSDTYVVKAHAVEPGPRLPQGTVEITVEDEIIAMDCLGPTSYDFGVMQEGTTKSTPSDSYFTIRNTGNVNEDLFVRGQDALSMPGEPSAKWVIAPVPGLDQFTMVLNPEGGVATSLDSTALGQQIWTTIAPSSEVHYGLTIWTPTAITTPARMWMRIMIYAVAT